MRIAIALFPDVEELDVVGPWEVLTYWAQSIAGGDVTVQTVAADLAPVRAAKGLRMIPDATLHDLPRPDVFVMPGGSGTRRLMAPDEPLLVALKQMAGAGTLMTSVCTGSLVYAAAGLLRGRPATSYFDALDELAAADPTVHVVADRRFVDDGDVITAAGVSAGIDMALHLVARLDSVEAARATRRGIQYDPDPPV